MKPFLSTLPQPLPPPGPPRRTRFGGLHGLEGEDDVPPAPPHTCIYFASEDRAILGALSVETVERWGAWPATALRSSPYCRLFFPLAASTTAHQRNRLVDLA